MPRYVVDVRLRMTYEVEAETEKEANEKAWDWFSECEPDFHTTRICCPTCHLLDEETRECPFADKCGVENNFYFWIEA